jgi:hypothetical protein
MFGVQNIQIILTQSLGINNLKSLAWFVKSVDPNCFHQNKNGNDKKK